MFSKSLVECFSDVRKICLSAGLEEVNYVPRQNSLSSSVKELRYIVKGYDAAKDEYVVSIDFTQTRNGNIIPFRICAHYSIEFSITGSLSHFVDSDECLDTFILKGNALHRVSSIVWAFKMYRLKNYVNDLMKKLADLKEAEKQCVIASSAVGFEA